MSLLSHPNVRLVFQHINIFLFNLYGLHQGSKLQGYPQVWCEFKSHELPPRNGNRISTLLSTTFFNQKKNQRFKFQSSSRMDMDVWDVGEAWEAGGKQYKILK